VKSAAAKSAAVKSPADKSAEAKSAAAKVIQNVLEEEALRVRWPRYSMPPGVVFIALSNHQEAERSFVFGFLFLFYEGECPVVPKYLRKCVGSIMKLDQKSKLKKS
jgi:hypothetical protein